MGFDISEAYEATAGVVSEGAGFIQETAGSFATNTAAFVTNDIPKAYDATVETVGVSAAVLQERAASFHENFVSKVVPQEGIYGDAANFGLEMIPGVAEYNDIRNGDWGMLAIDAGIDIGMIVVGAFTVGAGGVAFKAGARTATNIGTKITTRGASELGGKVIKETAPKGVSEVAEQATKKVTTERIENTAESGARRVSKEGTESITRDFITRNAGLEGSVHPITGVPFFRKEVITETGEKVSGVFPKFKSELDTILPNELLKSTDAQQFAKCNDDLLTKVNNDKDFASKFSTEQLEQIKDGLTPDGFIWHHNEEKGLMQLVDSVTHQTTGHTGGKAIWGGGR